MNTNSNGSNVPAFLEAGAKAGKELATMSRSGDKGEALAIVALVAARSSGYEMQYITPRTKDDSDDAVSFTLATYGNNIVSENGKNDSKAISARKAALYADLFGLSVFTPAQDSVIARAMVTAEYLSNNDVSPVINGKGQLVVPTKFMRPAPAADASDNVKNFYEATKDTPLAVDGSKGNSLRELRNRAVAAQPRKTRKARTTEKSAETDFRTAYKFLLSVIQTANNSDESPIAFKDDDLNALNMLAAGIATLNGEEATDKRKAA